jgi:hypothetical protein
MARLIIDTGIEGNPATGDTLRTAITKVNTNFSELYTDLAATTSSNGNLTNEDTNGDVKIFANGTGIVEIDRLSLNNTTISSLDTNADITLTANGTGNIAVSGPLKVGTGSAAGNVTSSGAQDIKIDTNNGTNSGYIEIKDGAGGNITIENDGSGDILLKCGGQVGIGDVGSPDTSLHIKQSTATITLQRTNDANKPGIDFQSNGGNVRAKMYMDGTDGTNKEIVFKTMDGSLDEKFRVTLAGAKVTGTLAVTGAATVSTTLGVTGATTLSGGATILGDTTTGSLTTNDITSNGSNADITIDPQGTGAVKVIGNLTLDDSDEIKFGDAGDLRIFHNGSHSIVRESGTGSLYLQSNNNVILGKDTGAEVMVRGIADGAVELYHDNNKKFETTSGGVSVTGNLAATGSQIDFTNLPTSDPTVAGRLWNDSGTVKISAG